MSARLACAALLVAACESAAPTGATLPDVDATPRNPRSQVVPLPQPSYPQVRWAAPGAVPITAAEVCVDLAPLVDDVDRTVSEIIAAARLQRVQLGDACPWTIALGPVRPLRNAAAEAAWAIATAVESARGGTSERYLVETRLGMRAHTLVVASSARAARWALRTALATAVEGTWVDWPAFARRGVIEGFYGQPYSESERSETLRLVERLRGNTYFYAPKADAYARERWAEPYPAEYRVVLGAAARDAAERQLDFVWGVAPGQAFEDADGGSSIVYSSDADFDRLTGKLEQLRDLGVHRFALLLDDTVYQLRWPEDQFGYGNIAAAHASLANRVQAWLAEREPGAHLWFVPNAYSTDHFDAESYSRVVGAALSPDIEVMWTGPTTYSASISVADVDAFAAWIGRPPLIWDNQPKGLAPVQGRDPALADDTRGLLTNDLLSMEGGDVHAFWHVMGPPADYSWAPERYSPSSSIITWLILQSRE